MAVDSLKRTGISLDLYVYDCGKDVSTLNTILAKNEMKSMNIIFGPMHQQSNKAIVRLLRREERHTPGDSFLIERTRRYSNNPAIYQINTPQSYLYSEVYEHFTRQFPNANVIFIEPTSAPKTRQNLSGTETRELKNKFHPDENRQ